MLNPFISSSTPAFKDNTAVDSATDESALNELVPIEVFLEFIQGLWVCMKYRRFHDDDIGLSVLS